MPTNYEERYGSPEKAAASLSSGDCVWCPVRKTCHEYKSDTCEGVLLEWLQEECE